jgi:hypothetical protein
MTMTMMMMMMMMMMLLLMMMMQVFGTVYMVRMKEVMRGVVAIVAVVVADDSIPAAFA